MTQPNPIHELKAVHYLTQSGPLLYYLTSSRRAGKRVRGGADILPNLHAPPTPPQHPYPDWVVHTPLAVNSSRCVRVCVCMGGGVPAHHAWGQGGHIPTPLSPDLAARRSAPPLTLTHLDSATIVLMLFRLMSPSA